MTFEWTQTSVSTINEGIVSFVAASLSASPAGVPDRACVVPGAEIAWDNCECGQLALAVTARYRSRTFPQSANDQYTKCPDAIMVISCTLSIARCVATVTDNGRAPACSNLQSDAETLEADAFLVWKNLDCILSTLQTQHSISDYIINDQTNAGPLGACAAVDTHFKYSQYIPCTCG